MSQPSICRRLSVAPLAGVERQGRRSLGGGGLAVGISHSLPLDPHFIQGTNPFSSVLPQFHQGQGFGGRSSFSSGERSRRAGSPSFSRLLQPSVCGDEGLRVVETGNRPIVTEPEGFEDVLQDGDSPVGPVVGPSWRLDGVSGLEGRLFAGSDASGISQIPQVCGVWEGLPVQSSLLWTLHGSTGLHTGHGSGFGFFTSVQDLLALPSRRLAHPSRLPGAGSPCSGVSPPALSGSRYHRQLGKVTSDSVSVCGISRGSFGLCDFQGFACPKESREASLNWRRVLVLRATASLFLAGAAGGTGFTDSAHSRGEALDAVSSVLPQVLGLFRSVYTGAMDSGDPGRSGVVARSVSAGGGDFVTSSIPTARVVVRRLGRRSGRSSRRGSVVTSSIPTARVVVRRLGRRLGRSSRRGSVFRPVVSERTGVVHQRQRASGHREGSVVFRSSGAGLRNLPVRRQLHRYGISAQPERHSFSNFECHSPKDSSFGGISEDHSCSSVYHGPTQCVGGRSISAKPDLGFRMDSEGRGLSGSQEKVASLHRPLCHLSKSLLFTVFLSFPQSECSGHGCVAPELEWVAGVCLSILVTHSSGSQEAPIVIWRPPDSHSSVLATASMVSGASGPSGGRSCSSSSIPGPSSTAPLSSIPSGGVKAVSSCLETIQ